MTPLDTFSSHRSAEGSRFSGWRGCLLDIGKAPVICLAAFMVATALGLVNLGIIFHARDALRASPAAVGWLTASWSVSYILGCMLLGPRLRRFAPRSLVVLSAFSMAAAFIGMGVAASVPMLFALVLAYGFMLSMFWPFLMGWLSMGYEGSLLGRVMSRYNLSWSSATVISPFLCGWLSERDTRLPIWSAVGLILAAGLLLLTASRCLPRIRNDQAHKPSGPGGSGPETAGRQTRLRFSAWAGVAVTFFGIGVIAAVFPVAARQDLGYSMFMVGNVMLVRTLFKAIGFVVLSRSDRWHFRSLPMLAGQGLGVFAFLILMVAADPFWIVLALAAFGFGSAISYASSMFHGVSGSEDRSRAMAIHEALLAAGLVGGSAIGGMVYQAAGMQLVYGLCAAVVLLVLPLQIGVGLWSRRVERPTAT